MVKLVLKYCVQKNLKDSKLTQNFYGNKTGFVRPGHIFNEYGDRVTIQSIKIL